MIWRISCLKRRKCWISARTNSIIWWVFSKLPWTSPDPRPYHRFFYFVCSNFTLMKRPWIFGLLRDFDYFKGFFSIFGLDADGCPYFYSLFAWAPFQTPLSPGDPIYWIRNSCRSYDGFRSCYFLSFLKSISATRCSSIFCQLTDHSCFLSSIELNGTSLTRL